MGMAVGDAQSNQSVVGYFMAGLMLYFVYLLLQLLDLRGGQWFA